MHTTITLAAKMKRFSIVLILLPLLFACGKDRNLEQTAVPMAFSTVEKRLVTRTDYVDKPVDQTVLHTVHNQISLFGVLVENEETPATKTTTKIFDNVPLECTSVTAPTPPATTYTSVWEYTPLRYWQDDVHYYFTGVFPYHPSYVTMDNEYFVNVQYYPGSNEDLMIARGYRYVESGGKTPVALAFNHATSAVRFLFGTASDTGSDYKITSFRIEDVVQNGTLKVASQSTSNPAITSGNWTPSSRGILATWNADIESSRITVPYPADVNDPEDYVQFGWYYMVPQTLVSTSAIRFSVSYRGGDPVETLLPFYGAVDQLSETGTSWIPNCVYSYFVTITQSGLNITVKTTPWDEVEVTTDDILFQG